MKLIKPTIVTDAMLTSSTVPETDYPEWSAATAYVAGNTVIRSATHRIYECLINHTNAVPEDNLTGTAKWLDIGPTNRWAMFDDVVGTETQLSSELTVVLRPGAISGIAFMELTGKDIEITLKDAPAGSTAYHRLISLDGSIITSFYDWFFQPYEQMTDFVLTDLPFHYDSPELTITITSVNVACGACKFGEVIDLGDAEYGVTAGITDYSRKERDTFGRYLIVERSFSKRADFKIVIEPSHFNRIHRALARVRATACVWIGVDGPGFEPLLIYGFYKDFSIDIAYPSFYYCNIELEGLI
jgi:hypothetical protein